MKISFNLGWFCIRCHFSLSMFLRLGSAGSIALQTVIFLSCGLIFLRENRVPVTELNFAKMFFNQANWISSRYQVRHKLRYVRLKRSF